MTLIHRIRMHFLTRRANQLLDRHCRPHPQNVYMISYPVEQQNSGWYVSYVRSICAVLAAVLDVFINVDHVDAPASVACAASQLSK
jgi:hypothetical protein